MKNTDIYGENHHLKVENIRLKSENKKLKIENAELKQKLTLKGVVVSDFCKCNYARHKDTWIRKDKKVICCHCHKQKH